MTKSNIVFVGFMGTGKTSAGRMLAKKLKKTLWDVDRWIEDKEKRSIQRIFQEEGEPFFRRLEKEAIEFVSHQQNAVITTGGGAVLDPKNIEHLSKNGWLIALHATPETIYKRVKHSKKRPLLQSGDMLTDIKRLLELRRPLYSQADFSVDTDGKSTSQVVKIIMKALEEK